MTKTDMQARLHKIATFASVVTLCVIILGAWVRLSHAGLGCPDWPGCYGVLTWPDAPTEIAQANAAFPERPVEVDKAWKEMVHRYLAGILILLVAGINWVVWRGGAATRRFRVVATFTLGLILFQAALGMWTVTLKLKPIIVMAHLLGGMTTLALLSWLAFRSRPAPYGQHEPVPGKTRAKRPLIVFALLVLVGQIALGGWTSANYAALSCPDLPRCTGQWWPDTDFGEAFTLWREVGVDYEGGILDQDARATIHLTHRIGAIITLVVLLLTAFSLRGQPALRTGATLLIVGVLTQFTLGILNIVLYLPLPNAVAHNGMAALLIVIMVWLLNRTSPQTAV
jgi:cytochrome c oxidase assembly protein subunit 15